jgi:hypothetical protein
LEVMMKRLVTGTFVALAIASGPAFACAEPPPAHVAHAPPAKSKVAAIEAKLKTVQTAVEAKFEAVDEDKSGSLSREEFAAAVTAGTIK